MSPQPVLRRKIVFQAPMTGRRPIPPAFIAAQEPVKMQMWKELSPNLTRDSYFVRTIYDLDRDDFLKADAEVKVESEDLESNELVSARL